MALTLWLVLVSALALGAVFGALRAELRSDGYGRRPAPRSHEAWRSGPLPSDPYRSRLA